MPDVVFSWIEDWSTKGQTVLRESIADKICSWLGNKGEDFKKKEKQKSNWFLWVKVPGKETHLLDHSNNLSKCGETGMFQVLSQITSGQSLASLTAIDCFSVCVLTAPWPLGKSWECTGRVLHQPPGWERQRLMSEDHARCVLAFPGSACPCV